MRPATASKLPLPAYGFKQVVFEDELPMNEKLRNFEPGMELMHHIERLHGEPSEENRRRFMEALEAAEFFVIKNPRTADLCC